MIKIISILAGRCLIGCGWRLYFSSEGFSAFNAGKAAWVHGHGLKHLREYIANAYPERDTA